MKIVNTIFTSILLISLSIFIASCGNSGGATNPIPTIPVLTPTASVLTPTIPGPTPTQSGGYTSPYSITYTNKDSDLTFDFNTSPRQDISLQFDPNLPPYTFANWYNLSSYPSGDASWGPHAAQFPSVAIPATVTGDSKIWKQERVLKVAEKYIGTYYQHHHIPCWDPSSDPNWPWESVSLGHNSNGVDCSNFSSWVYNYGLGIKLLTDIQTQGTTKTITGPGGTGTITVQTIPAQSYNNLISTLVQGDLLYIRSTSDPNSNISHVIMWIGKNTSSPDVPLIIDSHDINPIVNDKNGNPIPSGIRIRPFEESGWYYKAFDHAHRIIQ